MKKEMAENPPVEARIAQKGVKVIEDMDFSEESID